MAASPSHSIETSHTDIIHDSQFDYYGRFLATASSDKTVRVFAVSAADAQQQQQQRTHLATLNGHEGPVWMVAWAPPAFGAALASCGFDHKAILWKDCSPQQNGSQFKPVHVIAVHQASVNAVAWAPQEWGMAVVTAGSDGFAYVSSCDNGGSGAWREPVSVSGGQQQPAHPLGVLGASFAPMCDADQPVLLATCGCDSSVKIWTHQSGAQGSRWAEVAAFSDHSDWVRDVAFSPDVGPHVILASCSQDKKVVVRRAPREAARDRAAWAEASPPIEFAEPVWRLSWSPCGGMLLVTTGNSEAFVLKPGATFADPWSRATVETAAADAGAAEAQ